MNILIMRETTMFRENITENITITTSIIPDIGGDPPRRPTLQEILMAYSEYVWAVNLGTYVFPIIIGLGTIGNVLSFLIMIRRTMIITPTCFYMAILAISDTTILYVDCLRKWVFLMYGEDAWNINTAACRAFYYLSYSSFHYSVWIIVAMTTERFFAIRYPLKFLTVGSMRKTKVACLIILICVLLLNCQFTWSVKITEKGTCVPEENYSNFHKDVMPWIDAVFYSFLPFVILITFNVLIICSFRKAYRRQKTLHGNPTSHKSASHNRSSINHRMTAMLLSVTFTFIIMTAPKTILLCIRNEVFMFLKYNTYDFQEIALYTLITRIADLCIYTNHAINFFLYCVSGQRFRKEMKQLFLCRRSRSASLSLYSSKCPPSSRYQTMQTVSRGSYENDKGLESYHTRRTVSSNLGSNNNENCQDVNEQNERENSL